MKPNILLRLLSLILIVPLSMASCKSDDASDGGFMLYYSGVSNIGPSMTISSIKPSYYGGTPYDFAIEWIRLDGANYATSAFAIAAGNGEISIQNSDELPLGSYAVTVSCHVNGRKHVFEDAFVTKMIAILPAEAVAEPALVTVAYGVEPEEDAVTTSKFSIISEAVSIVSYKLIQEEGKDYFMISPQGIISFNDKFEGDVVPGNYPIDVEVTSGAGGKKIFEAICTFKVTAPPLELKYNPNSAKIEVGQYMSSQAPALKGSLDGIQYTLKSVSPANSGSGTAMNTLVSVDSQTGMVTVTDTQSSPKLAVGESYTVSVTVVNDYGTRDFTDVFTCEVVGFINPISGFSYPACPAIQACAFTAPMSAGFVGDDVTFAFDNLPAALQGKISIDPLTGTVSAVKGNTIPVGTYNITVKASNIKGDVTAMLALTVSANPNYFTYIRYGNNLGLTPAANYANQFRYWSAAELAAVSLVPETDASVPLTWKLEAAPKQNMDSLVVNPSTGVLTPSKAGYKQGNCGLVVITATAGTGETAISVSVPVFFNFPGRNLGTVADCNTIILYTPFVLQCNPARGATSAAPTFMTFDTHQPIASPDRPILDYRRTFWWFNINGPANQVTGQANITGSFTNYMWTKWGDQFTPSQYNYGSKNPVSYYPDIKNITVSMSQQMLYVDASDQFKVKVRGGNWWSDEYGNPAKGTFFAQMTYVSGGLTDVNNGNQSFPLFVWFDDSF